MANRFQDALADAVNYLVDKSVSKIDRDKTITATVVLCNNSLTNEYKLNYNNGVIVAYANEGASYRQNQLVYVLVPEGDFSKRKIILGPAAMLDNDDNITFVSSLLNDYNTIGDNVINDTHNQYPFGLHSYLREDYQLIYDRDLAMEEPDEPQVSIDIDKLNNYLKDAEAIMIEASFQTRLPKAHRLSKTGIYGIQFVLAFNDKSTPDAIKYTSYTLDSNNMTGNPLLYNSLTDQYVIYPIDAENFLYIESILFFSQNFVTADDYINNEMWGADIFVRDLEFYGLRKIDTSSGDYRLKVSTPKGATFKTTTADEELVAYGRTTYQINNDISDYTTYYWFMKDDRISSLTEGFQMYGGVGWRYLKDKGNSKQIVTTGFENRAYKNKYLCVAVYKDSVVLKDYFTLYNEASERDITITSDLGLRFSFDRGKPKLTCLIDGKESDFDINKPDEYFSFSWSKRNQDGSITVVNRTLEEVQQEYEQGLRDGVGYSTLLNLKNLMIELEGVEVNRNHFSYPVKNIDSSATFSCSIYIKDTIDGESYFAGSADITLVNEGAATPSDYYILITNGEQVFQYSESGVSPASERYTNPLPILPLECRFYDPAGLEINPGTYSIKWQVPLTNSLIVAPAEGLIANPANGLLEWYPYSTYPMAIAENFNYQALLNQITCIVTYNGVEYQRNTDFSFVKVGDNGTNGTDFVAKINETDIKLNNEPLTMEVYNNIASGYNTGQTIRDVPLRFELYNRNQLVSGIDPTNVNWSIQGGNNYSLHMTAEQSGVGALLNWQSSKSGTRMKNNMVVKATTRYDGQQFYAYYPVPVVYYPSTGSPKVHFNDLYLLKQVIYNADGHNPLYNKNQGIAFSIGTTESSSYSVTLTVSGGESDNSSTAPFKLSATRDDDIGSTSVTITAPNNDFICYVIPDLMYGGEYTNNVVHGVINGTGITFDVPIHFMLNTFGLASLNAWDGNHIEINEQDNYIMAPQIGAGYKDEQNKFTGIVMGQAKTYDQTINNKEVSSTGLLGYSKGQQSIWLDAETGKAVFGLPEEFAQTPNHQLEGRIELVPGGTSKIGSWKLGANVLYNSKNEQGNGDTEPVTRGPIGVSGAGVPTGAQTFIGMKSQGILLSANPPYLSIKSKPIQSINDDDANNLLNINDAVEIEMDPNRLSVFTVYRHYIDGSTWRREAMVGINNNGEFYTNALQHANTSFSLGHIGAFCSYAYAKKWIGNRTGYSTGSSSVNIVKFFIDNTSRSASSTLYISGATSSSDEYQRPISIHGKTVSLMSGSGCSTEGDYKVTIGSEGFYGGAAEGTHIFLSRTGASDLIVKGTFNEEYDSSFTSHISGTATSTVDRSANYTYGAGVTNNITGSLTETISGAWSASGFTSLNFSQGNGNGAITLDNTGFKAKAGANNSFSIPAGEAGSATLIAPGFEADIGNAGINMHTTSSNGAILEAKSSVGGTSSRLSLTPQMGGGSTFSLISDRGTIESKWDTALNRAVVEIHNYLTVPDASVTGTLKAQKIEVGAQGIESAGQISARDKNIVAYGSGNVYARWETGEGCDLLTTWTDFKKHRDAKYDSSENPHQLHELRDNVNNAKSAADEAKRIAGEAKDAAIAAAKDAVNSALAGKANKPSDVSASASNITLHYKGHNGDNLTASVAWTSTTDVANACARAISAM